MRKSPKPKSAVPACLPGKSLAEQRAKRDAQWREAGQWYERTMQPDGYITLELGYNKREEEMHKIVRAFFCRVGKLNNQHVLYESFWDIQPNSTTKKLHLHIFYRFEHTQVEPGVLERIWKKRIWDANWNARMKDCTHTTAEMMAKVASLQSDARYWAKADRYKPMDDTSHKGTLYQYTYTKHAWSAVGVGCPKLRTRCRKGRCTHHLDKENYWRGIKRDV